MKKKLIRHAGLGTVAVGVVLFVLHGVFFRHSNLLLVGGLALVLGGTVAHVVLAKRSSDY